MKSRALLSLGLISTFAALPGCAQQSTLDHADSVGEARQAAGSCTVSLYASSVNFAADGGYDWAGLDAASNCDWSESTSDAWITLYAPLSGTGPGGAVFSVDTNSGPARTGTITIGGQVFTVTQDAGSGGSGACTYELPITSMDLPAAGGSGWVSLDAPGGCAWTESTSDAWITLYAPTSGTGTGGAVFGVGPNPGAARSGTITLGGQVYTVTQDAGASCAAGTQNGNCAVSATGSGSTSGTCASGYTGSCSYSCSNGAWTQVSDACVSATAVISTRNLGGHSGYMLSNTACGGNCNIGGNDQQEATRACQIAGYQSAVTYSVANATFYPCWCLSGGSCCANNPGIPTAPMITSVTCSGQTGGSGGGGSSPPPPASCAAGTQNGNCTVSATNSGGTSGTCAGGYTGSCSYSCNNGTWTQASDTCSKSSGTAVVSTLNLAGHSGYMLSNTACGGNCNIGGSDTQEANYACQQAGYSSAVTYSVASASFYPCWCIGGGSCCANNPGIPTAAMITSVTCQ